jgi:hypothetical protein
MFVGRKVVYLEVYDVDMEKYLTIREDLDFCQRILGCPQPAFIQEHVHKVKGGVKLVSRSFSHILENPVHPVEDIYSDRMFDEAEAVSKESK